VFRISQALVLLVVIAGANRMIGQEKPASLTCPLYPLPRYEEDWSLLSDPAKRDDSWDPIKFIPLSRLAFSLHVFHRCFVRHPTTLFLRFDPNKLNGSTTRIR